MNTGTMLKASFSLIILCGVAGAYLKSIKSGGGVELLIVVLLSSFIFIATAVYEVNTSWRINRSEKTTWIIGLVLTSAIGGFFYLVSARNRIANKA